ncbi:hypothetical protein FOZ62_026432, partial [Perkinsus olseni]
MSKLSIRVEAHRCTCRGQLVYDINGEDVHCITSLLESDLVCRLVETLHGSASGPASQLSEFVELAVSDVQKGTALKYCEALGECLPFQGDQRGYCAALLPFCPDVGKKFPSYQQYFWEICCPRPGPTRRPHLYADKMYRQLSPEGRQLYQELVNKYVARGHWQPISKPHTDAAAEVFLTGSPSKGRLVCDFRCLNSTLPRSSTSGILIPVLMCCLRLLRPAVLVVADCHSAFYMLRHCNHEGCLNEVELHTGDGRYYSSKCVCFGVLHGPESLECSLGRQIEKVLEEPPETVEAGGIAKFVDDLTLAFSVADAARCPAVVATIIYFLGLCGFLCSLKKFAVIVQAAVADLLGALSEFVLPEGSMLGVRVTFDDDYLCFRCDQADRLKEAQAILEDSSWSKSQVYAACGAVGYDPLALH